MKKQQDFHTPVVRVVVVAHLDALQVRRVPEELPLQLQPPEVKSILGDPFIAVGTLGAGAE